jgi:hypothetical protein
MQIKLRQEMDVAFHGGALCVWLVDQGTRSFEMCGTWVSGQIYILAESIQGQGSSLDE